MFVVSEKYYNYKIIVYLAQILNEVASKDYLF